MKYTVTFEKPVASVFYTDLNDDMYIGVKFISRRKGFVMKHAEDEYVIASFYKNSSYDQKQVFFSISQSVKDSSVDQAFVFDTEEELLSWLCQAD